jgi:hypothetical protein
MDAHVDFLGILFIIWGALTALIGVSTLALGAGAVALITSSADRGGGRQVVAGVMAAVFTALAVIAILWGIAHIVIGLPLRRRRPAARILALVLGSVDLVL